MGFQWLQGFLSGARSPEQDPERSIALERAERALVGLPEAEARYVACVAFLMARVGHVDDEISDGEKARLLEVLRAQLKLPGPLAAATLAVAVEATLSQSVELHIVMRRLNELATHEQKHALIRMLFHVASDDDISEAESGEIGTIATAIHLPRSEYIVLRSEFRDQLAVLKGLRK